MTMTKIKKREGEYENIKIKKGDRYEIIKKYVTEKEILDLGCVDHSYERVKSEKMERWLHGFICRHAERCIGVDNNEREVKKLNEDGYNCVTGNVETLELGKKFEVIVAGELIEHLYNPGLFLESIKKHLDKNGVFILTTPNPFFLWRFVEILIKDDFIINDEHTCWFDPKTLCYLMMQHGFSIKEICWVTSSYLPHNTIIRVARAIRGYFCPSFLIVATIDNETEGD